MGRLAALGSPRVLFKGSALLLCIVLLVFLHTQENNKFVTKVPHEEDRSSMEERVSSRDGSMESAQFIHLSSKRRVPKGPDPIHNR
jgi:hypothetical protein